jgi:imidazole glycerol-phosphate synthase subunit HisH
MVVVIDYGLGNTRSVVGAVERLGFPCKLSADVSDLENADRLILPGVGAFADGMSNLRARGLIEPLTDLVVRRQRPILGICLGFQLMARESSEFGHHEGLGWLDATVDRLDVRERGLRLPHVGWNGLIQARPSVLFTDIPEDGLLYYVHSYTMRCADASLVTGFCDYGGLFIAAVEKKNIFGTQFHPEKSQLHGLRVLKNYLEGSVAVHAQA